MEIRDVLRRAERRLRGGPREGETRRDYLLRWSGVPTWVPKELYLELIELHDRVAALEAELAELRADISRR